MKVALTRPPDAEQELLSTSLLSRMPRSCFVISDQESFLVMSPYRSHLIIIEKITAFIFLFKQTPLNQGHWLACKGHTSRFSKFDSMRVVILSSTPSSGQVLEYSQTHLHRTQQSKPPHHVSRVSLTEITIDIIIPDTNFLKPDLRLLSVQEDMRLRAVWERKT